MWGKKKRKEIKKKKRNWPSGVLYIIKWTSDRFPPYFDTKKFIYFSEMSRRIVHSWLFVQHDGQAFTFLVIQIWVSAFFVYLNFIFIFYFLLKENRENRVKTRFIDFEWTKQRKKKIKIKKLKKSVKKTCSDMYLNVIFAK